MKTIGGGLSERKRRQMIGEAQTEATDSAGNFDPATFGTALAQRGLSDEARPLIALGHQQKLLRTEQRRRKRTASSLGQLRARVKSCLPSNRDVIGTALTNNPPDAPARAAWRKSRPADAASPLLQAETSSPASSSPQL